MNKKAFVLLYISTLAFIIAIFVFYGSVGKQTPGGATKFLGESEIEVFQTYQEAEMRIYFIELAARLSAKQASTENFQEDFERMFTSYLENNDLGIKREDYLLTYTSGAGTMTIVGIASKEIILEEGNLIYSIAPNFRVSIPFQETLAQEDIFA